MASLNVIKCTGKKKKKRLDGTTERNRLQNPQNERLIFFLFFFINLQIAAQPFIKVN